MPMDESDTDQMDMICQGCVGKHPFLVHYDGRSSSSFLRNRRISASSESREEIRVESAASATPSCLLTKAKEEAAKTIFLRDQWRHRVCRCAECSVSRRVFSLEKRFVFVVVEIVRRGETNGRLRRRRRRSRIRKTIVGEKRESRRRQTFGRFVGRFRSCSQIGSSSRNQRVQEISR